MAHSTKPTTRARLQAAIDGLLDAWRKADALDAPGMVQQGRNPRAIDAGEYGDPHQDTRPDFVRQDTDGWVSLTRFKR